MILPTNDTPTVNVVNITSNLGLEIYTTSKESAILVTDLDSIAKIRDNANQILEATGW